MQINQTTFMLTEGDFCVTIILQSISRGVDIYLTEQSSGWSYKRGIYIISYARQFRRKLHLSLMFEKPFTVAKG